MRLRIFLLSAMLLLQSALQAAQEIPADPPRFVAAGDTSGPPSSVITALAEDSGGMLWIGTARGLMRFDGYRFRLYGNHSGTPQEEVSLFVRSLLADADGSLWVGTDFNGLARYDPATDRLSPLDTQTPLPASYSVNALAMDSRGQLWAGTDDQGLLLRNTDGTIQIFHAEDGTGLPDNRIESLLIDGKDNLWLGSWSGLSRRAPDADNFTRVATDTINARITALLETSDGAIWIGSRGGQLWRMRTDGGTPHAVIDANADSSDDAIYALLQTDPNTLWVGRANGVEIRTIADGALLHRLHHQPGNPNSLASSEIRALLRDRGGQIWVGGYGGGVQRHNPLNTAFRLRDRHSLPGIDNLNVRAVAVLADGRILLGTHDRGIGVLDDKLRPLDVLRDANGEPLLHGVRITGLAETADGALWIGSDAGLFRHANDKTPLQAFAMESGRVRRLLADPRGDLWIAAEDGLWRHRPGATQLERIPNATQAPLHGDVNALGIDALGRIWFGGDTGLALLDTPDASPRRIEAAHPVRGSNPDVLGLLIDADGSVWFDTPSGLFHLHLAADGREQVQAVSQQYDLPSRPFGANLLRDAQGRLWTQDHILDPIQKKVLTLGAADGVTLGSAWFRAYAQTRDDILLFGGTQGLLAVLPAQFHFSDYDPPLAITGIRIDGTSVQQAHYRDGLTLLPGQRSLSIEFASLDYSAPERARYAYRLLGESENWTEVDASYRVATFANLPPGDYQFELRTNNRSGQLSENRLPIPLKVLPAWWQTWWAQLGGLLLLGGLVHGVIHQRTRWLRIRQNELERHVAARTKELQDVSAALREKSLALEEASLTDPLTGLRNRRYFSRHIETDVAESLTHYTSASSNAAQADLLFFMVDIDHFKQVNDNYGHAAGDAVLMQVAQRLRACFRDTDHLVRWGGEEFLVVARHTDRRHAAELAARVVQAIGNVAFELPDRRRLRRSCSLGHAAFPLQTAFPHQADWSEVVELADLALYAAKHAGRNGWVGIAADNRDPLPPEWLQGIPAMLDAGLLHLTGSLSHDAVRTALDGAKD